MRLITKIKIRGIKTLDWLNDKFYYYAPQPLMYASDEELTNLERKFYNDIVKSVDPDGYFAYAYHIDKAVTQNKWYPHIGDQCLHQWGLIGTVALKCAVLQRKEDYALLEKLINAGCSLITDEGKLLRGRTAWYKEGREGEWKRTLYEINSHNPSGDQLGGIGYGASIVKYLVKTGELSISPKTSQLIDETVKKLYQEMKFNWMMLTDINNEFSTGEFPYDSWKAINGQATTVLALTLLAGDYKFANELIEKYDYDKLCQYAEVHILGWNNWFMAHITAMSLFAIWLNNDFTDVRIFQKGLERIAYNTRDWGHGFYNLLWCFVSGQQPNQEQVRSWLASYLYLGIPNSIKKGRTWYGKKWQTAIPCRSRWDSDDLTQREMFVKPPADPTSPEGMYPNHKWGEFYMRNDYCKLYFLYKYLRKETK